MSLDFALTLAIISTPFNSALEFLINSIWFYSILIMFIAILH
nr:MAG TPA: hypothetical protein [Caudoviricetes sp.]